MTKNKIKTILELISQGWRAYSAEPQSVIYARLKCPYAPEKHENGNKKRKRCEPFWFVRSDNFVCIGCPRSCALSRPEGFIQPLPINYEGHKDTLFTLTPVEMVERKSLLRVEEAAYCLNISERLVRDWVAMGKLRRAKDAPVRIPSEDVKFCMNDLDE